MAKKKSSKADSSLLYKRPVVWDELDEKTIKNIDIFSNSYKTYLDRSKTERETLETSVKLLKKAGFEEFGKTSQKDKVYITHMNKALAIFRAGKLDISEGLNIIVAHMDSPRLDLKQIPLYEETGLALLKTHYYGGIKKYQWVSRPLALHGIVVKKDGTKVNIVIGEKDDEPVFTIADLLPHLASKAQMGKKASEFIEGEKLNIIFGSRYLKKDSESENKVKTYLLSLLNEKYDISEEDFISADLEIVPQGKARDIGLDRSLVGGYGHDDRVCSYASLQAILLAKKLSRPALILLLDKEEIGSEGATGANSWFIEVITGKILSLFNKDTYSNIRDVLVNSDCLSADVNAAVHPDWQNVHDKMNAGYLNSGLVLTKYTGVRGKGGSSEANAEFIAKIRKIFSDIKLSWHTAELGKVDEGGGGTIAKFMSYYGMNVIDAGVAVLDMHSPFEIISKADLWMMKSGFVAFLEKNK